jgi:hypothetical protein
VPLGEGTDLGEDRRAVVAHPPDQIHGFTVAEASADPVCLRDRFLQSP